MSLSLAGHSSQVPSPGVSISPCRESWRGPARDRRRVLRSLRLSFALLPACAEQKLTTARVTFQDRSGTRAPCDAVLPGRCCELQTDPIRAIDDRECRTTFDPTRVCGAWARSFDGAGSSPSFALRQASISANWV